MAHNLSEIISHCIFTLEEEINQSNLLKTLESVEELSAVHGSYFLSYFYRLLFVRVSNSKEKCLFQYSSSQQLCILPEALSFLFRKSYSSSILNEALFGSAPLDFVFESNFLEKFCVRANFGLKDSVIFLCSFLVGLSTGIEGRALELIKKKTFGLTVAALYTEGFDKQLAKRLLRETSQHKSEPNSFWSVLEEIESDSSIANRRDIQEKVILNRENFKGNAGNTDLWEKVLSESNMNESEGTGNGTASVATIIENILQCDASKINSSFVAKAIGLIVKTYALNSDEGSGEAARGPNWSVAGDKKSDDTSDKQVSSWDLEKFVNAVRQKQPNISWIEVARQLDHPNFIVGDMQGFVALNGIFKIASGKHFPAELLFNMWTNRKGQVSMLKYALLAAPEVFQFPSPARVISSDGLKTLPAANPLVQNWFSLDLLEFLLTLSDSSECYQIVRNLFDYPLQNCPEVLIIGLAQSAVSWNVLQEELCSSIMPSIFSNPNSSLIVHQLWQLRKSFVIHGMSEWHAKEPQCLSRILDVIQDLKALSVVLDDVPFSFVIDLAALASRREYLNLEKWLNEKMVEHRTPFIRACINFLETRALPNENSHVKVARLSFEITSTFLQSLNNHASLFSPEIAEEFRQVYSSCCLAHPKLKSILPSKVPDSGGAGAKSPQSSQFPAGVEEEANAYFAQIYSEKIRNEDVIEMLEKFMTSENLREQQVFHCMISNLFEEYQWFGQYPDRELLITGVLFGSIIRSQLVSGMKLGVALRYVLEALRKPADSQLFKFGYCALQQFRSRLHEWPQYCRHIVQLAHMRQIHPDIIQQIEAVLSSKSPAPVAGPKSGFDAPTPVTGGQAGQLPTVSAPETSFSPMMIRDGATPSSPQPSFGPSANITSLLQQDPNIEEPPEGVQDKISFIFNNLAENNLDIKMKELKSIVPESQFPWLIHYVLVKRVSQEANYLVLYTNFIAKIESSEFKKMLVRRTLVVAHKCLKSAATMTSSSSDRSVLKNFATFLGLNTLAINRPILAKDINFKNLIIEAYQKNRLIYTIPFVAKALECCAYSSVFRLPNPWLLAVMRLLKEMHEMKDIKLNLKFEIEVLCKRLMIDISELEPVDTLKNLSPMSPSVATEGYLGPVNYASQSDQKSLEPTSPAPPQPVAPATAASPSNPAPQHHASSSVTNRLTAAPLGPFLQINADLFQQYPQLKPSVQAALERTFMEVSSLVERTIAIAVLTTKQLVSKDFATDPDEKNLGIAARFGAQALAGSLTTVTVKEQVKNSFLLLLRNLIQQTILNGQTPTEHQQNLIDQTAQTVASDNYEQIVTYIERVAQERAVGEIDELLRESMIKRKQAREQGVVFIDRANIPSQIGLLPEQLRPNLGNPSPQNRAYKEFQKVTRPVAPQSQTQQQQTSQDRLAQNLKGMSLSEGGAASGLTPDGSMKVTPLVDKMILIHQEAERLSTMLGPQTSLFSLPSNHDISNLMRQFTMLLGQLRREDTVVVFIRRVVRNLFEKDSKAARELNFVILNQMNDAQKVFSKDLTQWVILSDEEHKFNLEITCGLIRAKLLIVPDFDVHLAKAMDGGRNVTAVEYTTRLLKYFLVDEKIPHVSRGDFANSLEALSKILEQRSEHIPEILLQMMSILPFGKVDLAEDENIVGLREQVSFAFEEWMRIVNQPFVNEKASVAFMAKLQQQGLLKSDEMTSCFVRNIMEISIEYYYLALNNASSDSKQKPKVNFQHLDGCSKLITIMVKFAGDPQNGQAKVNLLTVCLATLVNLVTKDNERLRPGKFDQRAYHRLFHNLLIELNSADPVLENINVQILTAFGNAFHTLNPNRIPAFAFAWLQIICHRLFMAKLLLMKSQKGWTGFQRLLIDLLKFLSPFLRAANLTEAIRVLYKGTIRVLLVLLHDFPQFLCDYHFSLCEHIPPNCVQMRNLILSAFPSNMRLPDPFTPNLKVDLLPEIQQSPRILSNYPVTLQPILKKDVDTYLKTRAPNTFLKEICSRLLNTTQEQRSNFQSRYNVPVLNALVLYIGVEAIAQVQSKNGRDTNPITHSAPMDIFQQLIGDFDAEGRYLFLNAIANQLRYPNNHTHYFSCILLYLFAESQDDVVKEQITRVLVERLIVNRPHPWGLLITFIELIKNPRYNFWAHNFVRCAPEIERLFKQVAMSCMYSNNSRPPQSAGGAEGNPGPIPGNVPTGATGETQQ
eukprot:Nk52_evm43s359 gene=Nk52_evmTU43s359